MLAAPLAGSEVPAATGPLRPLVGRLSSTVPAARAEAACALGQRRADAASPLPALAGLLGDSLVVGPVECGMSEWLRKLLVEKPEEWRKFETSPGREAAKAMARIGRPAVSPL